jgi:hypothetical protein
LQSQDRAGLRFEVRYHPAGTSNGVTPQKVTIDVLDEDRVTTQTIAEQYDGAPVGTPELEDVDHDGRDELRVPGRSYIGANTSWVYWRAIGDSTVLRRQPEMVGLGASYDERGYVVLTNQGGYAYLGFIFFKSFGPDWREVADIVVQPQFGEQKSCRLGKVDPELRMTNERAQRYFCGKSP